EGLDVLFGGNPILFVGIGLSEGDILRPLREFLQGNLRRNRNIFALRAADQKKAVRDTFTMEQFTRHGVHVLHYGKLSKKEAESSVQGEHSSAGDADKLFWMQGLRHAYDKLNATCSEIIDSWKLDQPEESATKLKEIRKNFQLNRLFEIG